MMGAIVIPVLAVCLFGAACVGWVIGRRFGENTARNVVLTELHMIGLAEEFANRLEQRQRAFAKATTRS